MIKPKYLALCLFFTSLCSASSDTPVILSHTRVEAKAKAIKKMINRDHAISSGLMAVASLEAIIYSVKLLSELLSDSSTAPVLDNKEEDPRGILTRLAQDTQNLFCTSQGWLSIGKFTVYLGSQVGATLLIQYLSNVIGHPNSLRWYITTHAPYEAVFTNMENISHKLAASELSPQERAHYSQLLILHVRQLIGYAEDMCAYMTYKAAELPEHQKMIAERTAGYLFNYHNDMINQIAVLLHADQPDYSALRDILKTYRAELKYQRKIFKSVEIERVYA